jgi:hypothetical protein
LIKRDKNKLTKSVGNFQGLPRKEKEREKEKASEKMTYGKSLVATVRYRKHPHCRVLPPDSRNLQW